MAGNKMDWFRSHHGAPTDPKWLLIARRAETQPGVVAAVWWALMDFASQQGDRGSVVGFDAEELAVFFGFEEQTVSRIVEALRDKGLIGENGHLAAWEERQPKREDSSAERMRRLRERQAHSPPEPSPNGGVTHSDAPVTHGDAPEREGEGEKKTIPVAKATGAAPPGGKPASKEAQRDAILDRHGMTLEQLRAHQGEAARIIRTVWWQGKKPPDTAPPGWSMAREIDVWAGFCLEHPPEEVNGGLEVARDALAGELRACGLPMGTVMNQSGQRDMLERCIALWRRKQIREVNNLGLGEVLRAS